ncbi:MAG: hydantoinase B/oxoprolinase family protein, partial [Paracraurococcus sp.]
VVVASRRNVAPHGLAGGADGAPGRQWVERADGRIDPIPGNAGSAELAPGDALVLETPGGGGWGPPGDRPGGGPV